MKEHDKATKAIEKARTEINFIFAKLHADINSIFQKEVTFIPDDLNIPPF